MELQIKYYDMDGQPIEGGTLAWAELFENSAGRIIGQHRTLYGEKLSTVWLGLNHNWGDGPPLIFETMLFAPDPDNIRRRSIRALAADAVSLEATAEESGAELEHFEAYIKKHYPHDQLQIRYSTKAEARRSFEKLRRQCLIPPRLRRFILYRLGKDATWS